MHCWSTQANLVVEACAMIFPPIGFTCGPPYIGMASTVATTWLVNTTATLNCPHKTEIVRPRFHIHPLGVTLTRSTWCSLYKICITLSIYALVGPAVSHVPCPKYLNRYLILVKSDIDISVYETRISHATHLICHLQKHSQKCCQMQLSG